MKKKFVNKINLYQGNINLSNDAKKFLEENYFEKVVKFIKESAFVNFIKENYEKDKLIIDEIIYHNKETNNRVYRYIKNVFELEIWLIEKRDKFSKYFTKRIVGFISEQAEKYRIPKEIIQYTIIHHYINDLKQLYLSSYKLIRENVQYKIRRINSITTTYKTWILEQNGTSIDTSEFENYGYSLNEAINRKNWKKETGDRQYLDSFSEHEFLWWIFEEFDEEEDYAKKVQFFAKMPTYPSDVYFEYIKSEDMDKHKAYIDFALITDDRVLMIEVKGWNDYDPNKTKDLLYAFKKYTELPENSNLELKICYSGKMYGETKKPRIQYLVNENGKDKLKGQSLRKMLEKFLKNND